MAGPFQNPWQYAVVPMFDGRWAMLNTCHNRVVSTHATREQARDAIASRRAGLAAVASARRKLCPGPGQTGKPLPSFCFVQPKPAAPAAHKEPIMTTTANAPISERDARRACEAYTLDQLRHAAHILTGDAPEFMIRKTLLWRRIVAATPATTTPKRAIADALLKPAPGAEPQLTEPPPAAVLDADVAQQRSAAALKAWATRRAQGWRPSTRKAPPEPLRRVDLSQLAEATA